MLVLDDEWVDPVEEDVSNAAGVNNNGNVLGDEDVEEADDESVEEPEVDDRDDRVDNVDAADDESDEDEEYFE